MAETTVLSTAELPPGTMKVIRVGQTDILLINDQDVIAAVQPKCPHAGAPLKDGAVCNGRLVCPWHMGTFALPTGELLEPPAMEPLKTYAVRVEGGDILIDPTAEHPVFLLVGAGAAGVMAATTLHGGGFKGKIIVVDPLAEEPVDRTQLSKDALGGNMPLPEIKIDPPKGLAMERLNASVVKFSAAKQQALLSNGMTVNFDKALVATGGKPKRLDIPGAELAFTIRHSEDVRRITEALKGKRSVVVIGTSFIGLEAASALVQKGLQVTVVGKEKLPFEKQFGTEVATALKSLHESHGTKFKLGVEIVRIAAGEVTVLAEGSEERIAADLVVMGVGVSPQLDFAHDLPMAEEGGGIRTDDTLRAAGTVWVAGDIANVNGRRIEHWRVAQQHARIAALAMMGRQLKYEGPPYFWTYHFGKRFGYLGHAEDWDSAVIKGDLKAEFMVSYIKDGLVVAALNYGHESEMAALTQIVR
jgi:NADPH-dependent 2,4-dienoyl-CoA reductase/sulfur reductase-like enzyme/nitrite reductase/ring-hydroxylating ferredoxin subunit